MMLGIGWGMMVYGVPLAQATDEQMHFMSMAKSSAVTDAALFATSLTLEVDGVRFAVGHRVAHYPINAMAPSEVVLAVFGVWFPSRQRRRAPAGFHHLLYITDMRILLVLNASPWPMRPDVAGNTTLGRASATLADIASRIAGPYYVWTAEAWQAELEVGPVGAEAPMSAIGKLRFALDLLLITAPRLRLASVACVTGSMVRMLWLRALYSNAATGIVVGGVLGWAAVVFRAESGSATAATFLTTAVPSAAWGVRWLRAHNTPPRRNDD
ncbi:hypothetical protein ABH920_007795 [Catenulispora sp. EB89]|uniref:hypothetical protein n=1 Tax=Catenulispora sp. EB89 TaxID=3156257 RepID=UPI0035159EFB